MFASLTLYVLLHGTIKRAACCILNSCNVTTTYILMCSVNWEDLRVDLFSNIVISFKNIFMLK